MIMSSLYLQDRDGGATMYPSKLLISVCKQKTTKVFNLFNKEVGEFKKLNIAEDFINWGTLWNMVHESNFNEFENEPEDMTDYIMQNNGYDLSDEAREDYE